MFRLNQQITKDAISKCHRTSRPLSPKNLPIPVAQVLTGQGQVDHLRQEHPSTTIKLANRLLPASLRKGARPSPLPLTPLQLQKCLT